MYSIVRKPRPLKRDSDSLRDDRLFIIACDDTYAPKQYFDFFRIPRIQIHVVATQDGSSAATHVLARLQAIDHDDDDERWLVLDTDHSTSGQHLREFTRVLQEANQQGIRVALSKPCFEVWLLLHHENEAAAKALISARAVGEALRGTLGNYNKAKLKREDYPAAAVCEAFKRAERLDATVSGGDIPSDTTTRVHLLWKAIAAKALAAQMPEGLRCLVP